MRHSDIMRAYSQELRRHMTKNEKHLWYDFLKLLPITVQRQKIIDRYILDFYIAEAKLAIELDGSQHYKEENKLSDANRDKFLLDKGIKVVRYTNLTLHENFEGVCADILNHIFLLSNIKVAPHPSAQGLTPSPQGEG